MNINEQIIKKWKELKKKKRAKSQFTHNFCVHNPANWRWILGSCEQLPVPSVSKPTNDIVKTNRGREKAEGGTVTKKGLVPRRLKLYGYDGALRSYRCNAISSSSYSATREYWPELFQCTLYPHFFQSLPSHCSSFFLHRV